MMPVDPAQLAKIQETSCHLKGQIDVKYKDDMLCLTLSSEEPNAKMIIPNMLDQLANGLATQLSAFFKITGKITEIDKPK